MTTLAMNASTPRPNLTLDELTPRGSSELESVFARGSSFPLESLTGDPRGRALAAPGLDRGPIAGVLRTFHALSWPWEGKTFGRVEGSAGVGTNRVKLPFRRALFDFRTYATRSVVDGAPCIAIDYDVPRNPRLARGVYDELRQVGDALYLGRGTFRTGPKHAHLLIWFALDASRPDARVSWPGYPGTSE